MSPIIQDVTLSKNTVTTGEKVLLSVAVLTWDYLNKNYTWESLKDSGLTWGMMVRSDSNNETDNKSRS